MMSHNECALIFLFYVNEGINSPYAVDKLFIIGSMTIENITVFISETS